MTTVQTTLDDKEYKRLRLLQFYLDMPRAEILRRSLSVYFEAMLSGELSKEELQKLEINADEMFDVLKAAG